jgi:2-polyprenyl-6-methoxyphenol hydroxylase-like FAD-dependent oxidoreductase
VNIGIVGTGISGLQLALRLQQRGIDTTVYAPHPPEKLAAGRAVNFVARFGHTQQRERDLGVHHWMRPDAQVRRWQVTVVPGPVPPLRFSADLIPPSSVVDFRLYLPRLLGDYVDRGGRVVVGPLDPETARWRDRDHDLVVVANGWRSIGDMFPTDDARSPYRQPQRILCAGLYRGVIEETPQGLDYVFHPGIGEILCMPFYSMSGRVDVVGFEAVPGGPLADLAYRDYGADPAGFERAVLGVLADYAPALRERVDESAFELTRPVDLLQGSVTPAVRQGWAELGDGLCAVAVGDAWITNDPITAQGANLGSYCAFALADAITRSDGRFDVEFCRQVERTMWSYAEAVVGWTNMFLGPPPESALAILGTAAQDERVASAFVNAFNDPATMWDALSSAEGTAAFIQAAQGATELVDR